MGFNRLATLIVLFSSLSNCFNVETHQLHVQRNILDGFFFAFISEWKTRKEAEEEEEGGKERAKSGFWTLNFNTNQLGAIFVQTNCQKTKFADYKLRCLSGETRATLIKIYTFPRNFSRFNSFPSVCNLMKQKKKWYGKGEQ